MLTGEQELVGRAQRGDREAFTALASLYVDRLYAVATLMLHRRDAAEDAVQEALIRAWRDLHALRDAERVGAWLRRLVVRACYDEARHSRRHAAQLTVMPIHDPAVAGHEAPAIAREALDRAFRRLSIDHRAAIVLRYFLDLSVPEMADAMSVPLGTGKSRLHHAERALRAVLEADDRLPSRVREVGR
ncbi:MAG: RNA polymerase sigma factor [Chloroflexi bacterium]|nr:RNA polymerase sigma factor [Chloroflexota bacterium]